MRFERADSPLFAAPYFLASRMAFSARVSLVEATTFIDYDVVSKAIAQRVAEAPEGPRARLTLVIFSMFLTDFNLGAGVSTGRKMTARWLLRHNTTASTQHDYSSRPRTPPSTQRLEVVNPSVSISVPSPSHYFHIPPPDPYALSSHKYPSPYHAPIPPSSLPPIQAPTRDDCPFPTLRIPPKTTP
jgi:hypothetical protein